MNKIFILYTEEEGGDYKFIAKHTEEETIDFYNTTIKTGLLKFMSGQKITKLKPKYITLAKTIEDYDFI